MVDETVRKKVALEYCRRINAGDVAGLMNLFSERVRFEDPVGCTPVVGRSALRVHVERLVASNVVEEPGVPVAGHDGQHVAVPMTATLDYAPIGPMLAAAGLVDPPDDPAGARLHFNLVALMRVGADGLLHDVRVFWGRTDVSVT